MGDSLAETIKTELESELPDLPPQPRNRQTRWTMAELYSEDFPEPKTILPKVITVGLTNFGGRPKKGKSLFMQGLAGAVSTGGKYLGLDVERGPVFYLGLEDSPKRFKERALKMGIPGDADIVFVNRWKPLHKGGLNELLIELESNDYRLAVIDTLTRATPGIDPSDSDIGPIMAELQSLALRHDMSITTIDHTRKPSGMYFDPIDEIMGNTAKSAVADVILALHTEQGKRGAWLKGRGRDIDEVDIRLIFDNETFCWQSLGNSYDLEVSERETEILAALEDVGPAQASTVAKNAGQDASNTRKRLIDLANRGLIAVTTIEGKQYYAKK